MINSREQLSQEERALAERLSHISSTGGPRPALDARILSAAQAALTTEPENTDRRLAETPATTGISNIQRPSATKARPPRTNRWGWRLGLAASLTLAVGLAWQLRPQHKPVVVYETATTPTTPTPSNAPSQARAMPSVQPSSASAASNPVAQGARAPVPARPTPFPARAKVLPLPAKPSIGVMADHALVRLARPPQLRATIAPTQQSATFADNAHPLIKTQPHTFAAAAAASDSVDASVTMHAAVDQDALLPVDAWLRAIRRHRFEGHGALARASLQAFREAHPDQAIPEDLRALLP